MLSVTSKRSDRNDILLLCWDPIISLSTLTIFMTNNNISTYPWSTAMPGYCTQLEARHQLWWSNQQLPYGPSQEWILYRNVSGNACSNTEQNSISDVQRNKVLISQRHVWPQTMISNLVKK